MLEMDGEGKIPQAADTHMYIIPNDAYIHFTSLSSMSLARANKRTLSCRFLPAKLVAPNRQRL
jgi:hypothetical protein